MSPAGKFRLNDAIHPQADGAGAVRELLSEGGTGRMSGVLALALERLGQQQSLLHAYEDGHILLMGAATGLQQSLEDPVLALRGRISAAKQFVNRLRSPDMALPAR
jgi:hypothetical protein